MKKILEKELLIRMSGLALIVCSVFIRTLDEKMLLLIPGIGALLLVAVLKKQKVLIIIYGLLMCAAIGGYLYANEMLQ